MEEKPQDSFTPPELAAWYFERTKRRNHPPLGVPWFLPDVASYLGIAVDSARVYRERANRAAREGTRTPAHLPDPDGNPGRGMWWWPNTIIRWDKFDRPQQGAGGGNPALLAGSSPATDAGKVLSVQQWWAWSIFHAGKNPENRTWPTKYRGRLWIHAGAKVERHSRMVVEKLAPKGIRIPDDPPRSCLLGYVTLVDVVQGYKSPWAFAGDDVWHWVIEDPVPLDEPIPMPGALRLFSLPDDVNARLKRLGLVGSTRTNV